MRLSWFWIWIYLNVADIFLKDTKDMYEKVRLKFLCIAELLYNIIKNYNFWTTQVK